MRILTRDRTGRRSVVCDLEVALARLSASGDRFVTAKWRKLIELVQHLSSDGPVPEASALILGDVVSIWPRLPLVPDRITAEIGADWNDYGPVQDGMPVMHYRIKIRRPGVALSEDFRVDRPEQARPILREAFGWH